MPGADSISEVWVLSWQDVGKHSEPAAHTSYHVTRPRSPPGSRLRITPHMTDMTHSLNVCFLFLLPCTLLF